MLAEEWGLQLRPLSEWRSGLATFVAFVLAGFVPLLPTMLWFRQPAESSFLFSSLATAATFFAVGLVRGRLGNRRMLVTGIETLALGGAAALIAFAVGALLEQFASV
jgi:VIT1/CCC1 family predicted Fe2+/Mn2+ transporter